MLADLNNGKGIDGMDLKREVEKIQSQMPTADEDVEDEMVTAWGDVSGAALDPKAVKAARAEEIAYVRKNGLIYKNYYKGVLNENG